MAHYKKIAILLENRFIDQEIIYYAHRFKEEDIEVDFLTRLWGNKSLTFTGMELGMKFTVSRSFEDITRDSLKNYSAVIMPAGYVADMLRYSEDPETPAPAVSFMKMAMEEESVIKAAACHALWIFDPIPEVIRGRRVTCHNNIIGSVKNTGAIYINEDIVIDKDLITAREGGLFAKFARAIIDEINRRR